MGVHIFTKIKNTDSWKKKKKIFSVISFQKFLIFPIWAFTEMFKVSSEHSFKPIIVSIDDMDKFEEVL